jgi:lysophospholipase L1-like esterase
MKALISGLRTILCCLILVSVLEVCCRVDDAFTYGAPFSGTYNDQSLYTTDKIGKWGKPAGRYQGWQLNSLGFRGPELRPGTLRIVCFGASETFGLYEAPDQEYPRQLERDLNDWAGVSTFQVVNAAYPGETLKTATLRVAQVVSEVHPSYALIYPALAEYIDIAPVEASSAFAGNATALSDRNVDLRIVNRIRDLLKATLPENLQSKLRQLEIQRESAHMVVMDRMPEENVERFREDLTGLLHKLREYHVQPVLVTHATTFGPVLSARDRDLLTSWRKFYPMLKESGFIDMEGRLNEVIRKTAVHEKLPIIDAASEMPHGPEYFADFVHFTTAGAQVIAAELAAQLKPFLSPRSQQIGFGESVVSVGPEIADRTAATH